MTKGPKGVAFKPFFVLFYLEGPLISTLQAIGKANITMRITLYGIIIDFIFVFANAY
jgi:O-antigen/teichoic acid export membrane protein